MKSDDDKFFVRPLVILISIFVAGICWYFSTGLKGDLWWLAWFAPLPILLIVPEVSSRRAFWIAFTSYLLGRLSWIRYLHSVVPVILVIIFTMALPLVFAFILLATRKIVLRVKHWTAFLSFPVLYTGFEWVYFQFSKDGTAGSLAYSQSNCLPLIQIASITGVTGISFFICMIPALLAAAFYFRRSGHIYRIPLWILFIIGGSVFLFGFIRLHRENKSPGIRVGMIVIDEPSRRQNAESILQQYAKFIDSIRSDSLKLIILPEKIVPIQNDSELGILMESARKYQVDILVGITRGKENDKLNQALLISYDQPVQIYTKVNLYEGEAYEGFRPGRTIAQTIWRNVPLGLVVCKDMDFDHFIRQYQMAFAVLVPAWDFVQDDWMHSRMAILRGIENGFSIARNARQGRLTITDYRGRVLHEISSADGKAHVLTGQLPLEKIPTLYSRIGNLFGFLNLIASGWILILLFRKKAS